MSHRFRPLFDVLEDRLTPAAVIKVTTFADIVSEVTSLKETSYVP